MRKCTNMYQRQRFIIGKDLGKVFARNSHDYQPIAYKIRQTYAVYLISLFMRRVTLRYPPLSGGAR